MSVESINPANGKTIETYETLSGEDLRIAVESAHRAFVEWRRADIDHRAPLMNRAAGILREHRDELAELMAEEMGKPVSQGRSEVDKCAWVSEYYADNAASMLTPEMVSTDATTSYVSFQPLGVVLAVMPWNFPFWQVFRFAAPSLMAGNAAVLKHASNVFGCALAIEDIFREAGFPKSLFRTLLIGSDRVKDVIEHRRVAAATLTGSTPAGRAVAAAAGRALKKTVLELGGSDPYVILDDADMERAVATCVTSRLINSGQSCIAAKRFIVTRKRREEFAERFVSVMKSRKMGDPLDEDTDIGPLARHDLRDDLHRQVTESVKSGAKCLLGGKIPDGPGAYYPPTVLIDVRKGTPAYDEELFGPVASIITVDTASDAIDAANDSSFGLGAAVFTRDRQRGEQIAEHELEAGNCFVNAFVKSDPRLPFGGMKESGYGRELGVFGIREFVNVKTVYVA
jgi:succinate-semialdehyde dehydrogenase/glutarate-semialdehyde dehydrogenase